ncbi:polyneuridine-aldehyde esterase-like [Syzygium oleosum]|uniref:polyneuridine-aldehyde esterase-like n=1 Tax=Syzygium oleosum TaxID=219896 RepID=UPI0011D25B68|nr:polyneuridine-aldehyde esterase-like [Syzygium oleosum]
MESFPERIEVAVYVAAFMPRPRTPPVLLLQEFFRESKLEASMNKQYTVDHNHDWGQRDDYMTDKLHQNCSPEVLELAKKLPTPARMFLMEDLANESLLTEERFGSVERVFVMCGEDKANEVEFQRRMMDRSPPKAVKLIGEADHMAVLSNPMSFVNASRRLLRMTVEKQSIVRSELVQFAFHAINNLPQYCYYNNSVN